MSDGYLTLALLRNRGEATPSGINHFGFQVDDIKDTEERLKKFEEPLTERPANRPYAEYRAMDPDGNLFDVSAHGYEEAEFQSERETRSPRSEGQSTVLTTAGVERCDVIVIGGGSAAFEAAVAARASGAEKIIMLEKAPESEYGGNARYSGTGFRFWHEGLEKSASSFPTLTAIISRACRSLPIRESSFLPIWNG
jgi:hypothetical protein